LHVGAQGLEDAADVGVLQREAELDPEEPEAHVPDLPERQLRLARHAHTLPVDASRIVTALATAARAATQQPEAGDRRVATVNHRLFSGLSGKNEPDAARRGLVFLHTYS